jgi:hypothetical protein
MKPKFISLVCLSMMASLASLSSKAIAADNCDLAVAPLEAGPVQNHGYFVFVFPRVITANYTGCQTTWFENGDKWWFNRFEHGVLVEISLMLPDQPAQTCMYRDLKLFSGDPNRCPAGEALKPTYANADPVDDEPVPPERDPRRK